MPSREIPNWSERESGGRAPLSVAVVNAITWWNIWFTAALLVSSAVFDEPNVKLIGLSWVAWLVSTPVLSLVALVLIRRHGGARGRTANLALLALSVLAVVVVIFRSS